MSTEENTTPVCDTDAGSVINSLNRPERLAVLRAFRVKAVNDLIEDPFECLTAAAFVHKRRCGLSDKDAMEEASALTIQQLGEYFPKAPTELDPEDPVTDSGKLPTA